MYKAKLDTFLCDQISLIKFWKNKTCSISSNEFDEDDPDVWRKNYESKTGNEWTRNIFSCKQEFTTSNCTAWVYNLKI